MKKYILIAGVNGSGKSTLYHILEELKDMPRVNTDEIAKERVAHRVSVGGHGIPEKDIERRYIETFENLNKIVSECDRILFYDNTHGFERFAVKEGRNTVISYI